LAVILAKQAQAAGRIPDGDRCWNMESGETQIAGRYSIVSEIGSGGMATVYHALDEVLQRDTAIKIFHDIDLSESSKLDWLLSKARGVATLQHPNIVTVYDVGHEGEHYQDLVFGETFDAVF